VRPSHLTFLALQREQVNVRAGLLDGRAEGVPVFFDLGGMLDARKMSGVILLDCRMGYSAGGSTAR
jgi:hypothetical protein